MAASDQMTARPELLFPGANGRHVSQTLWPPALASQPVTPVTGWPTRRSCCHVVADPLLNHGLLSEPSRGSTGLQTMAFRHHLWKQSFAVAEAILDISDVVIPVVALAVLNARDLVRHDALLASAQPSHSLTASWWHRYDSRTATI